MGRKAGNGPQLGTYETCGEREGGVVDRKCRNEPDVTSVAICGQRTDFLNVRTAVAATVSLPKLSPSLASLSPPSLFLKREVRFFVTIESARSSGCSAPQNDP